MNEACTDVVRVSRNLSLTAGNWQEIKLFGLNPGVSRQESSTKRWPECHWNRSYQALICVTLFTYDFNMKTTRKSVCLHFFFNGRKSQLMISESAEFFKGSRRDRDWQATKGHQGEGRGVHVHLDTGFVTIWGLDPKLIWIFLEHAKAPVFIYIDKHSVWFYFLSNWSKQQFTICLKKDDSLHRSSPMLWKIGLLEKFQ